MNELLEGLNNKQYEGVVNTDRPMPNYCRGWKWKNKSNYTQNSIFNTRKKC